MPNPLVLYLSGRRRPQPAGFRRTDRTAGAGMNPAGLCRQFLPETVIYKINDYLCTGRRAYEAGTGENSEMADGGALYELLLQYYAFLPYPSFPVGNRYALPSLHSVRRRDAFAFPYGRTVRDDRFVVGNRFVDRCRSGFSFRKDDRYADLCFLFAVRFAPSFAWHFAQGSSCFHLRVIYRQVFVSHGFSGNSFRRGKSVCFL